jgi:uncharacterized membrane protein HdeD (DUF308 family)
MSPMAHPLFDFFLLGFIAACSLVAGLFFLRFWRSTQDLLFIAFSLFFVIQGACYIVIVSLPHPNEGSLWVFLLRLLSIFVVLGAIIRKNSGDQ